MSHPIQWTCIYDILLCMMWHCASVVWCLEYVQVSRYCVAGLGGSMMSTSVLSGSPETLFSPLPLSLYCITVPRCTPGEGKHHSQSRREYEWTSTTSQWWWGYCMLYTLWYPSSTVEWRPLPPFVFVLSPSSVSHICSGAATEAGLSQRWGASDEGSQ